MLLYFPSSVLNSLFLWTSPISMERRRRRSQEHLSAFLSILTTTTLLALLYLPHYVLSLLLSPVPIATFLLLTALFLSSPPPPKSPPVPKPEPVPVSETQPSLSDPHPKPNFCDTVVEWVPLCGPLEVIYECEEEDEDVGSPEYSCMDVNGFGLAGFLLTDSDEDTSECPSWEEEDLIEIALEEEEGLIEIDISSCR